MSRTLFVDPPSPPGFIAFRHAHGGLGEMCRKSRLLLPSLDLFHAAAREAERGAEVSLLDCVLDALKPRDAVRAALKRSPDSIVLRVAAGSFRHDLAFAASLRRGFDGKIFLLGPHAAAETAAIAASKAVDGLWPDPASDLRSLPVPLWDLTDYRRYSFVTSQTSWGCPVGCGYCPYPLTQGRRWRSREPGAIVSEFKTLRERYRVPFVMLRDPYFGFDRAAAAALCRALSRAGSPILWGCETRLDGLTPGLVDAMAQAGCIRVVFGVESASPRVLAGIGRPSLSQDGIRSKVALLKSRGMLTYAFYIIGLPGETRESSLKTIEFALELGTNAASFSAATPFEGTALAERAEREGLFAGPERRRLTTSVPSMRNETMSAAEIGRLCRLAKKRWRERVPA